MPDKTQPTAHAEITAPISANLRRIDDAGAQPKQQPEALRLAEILDSYVPPGGSGPISQAAAELRSQYAAITATASAALMRSQRARIAELEALQAAPPAPAAVAMPESHTQALKAIAEWPVTDMLLNMDAANMRGIAQRALAAAPEQAKVSQDHFATAQEHATQLAGQAVSMSHREWRFALQEAIETMDAEIDSRGDESNVRRMKRAKAVLSTMLAAPAQAQEDARDAERVEWAMNNMVVHRHSHAFAVHVLNRGGTGDLGDCRTYIDAARAAQGGA